MTVAAKQLTTSEVGVTLGCLHEGIRKVRRNRERGRRRWGRHYDPKVQEAREELLRSAYLKLGGDPKSLLDWKEKPSRDPL